MWMLLIYYGRMIFGSVAMHGHPASEVSNSELVTEPPQK
jgi:hypothetical protein